MKHNITNTNKILRTRLAFSILVISMFLSFIVSCSDIRDDLTTPDSADSSGDKNINIRVRETQLITYDAIDVDPNNPDGFTVEYTGWQSELFEIDLINITDNIMADWTIQNNTHAVSGDWPSYTIPMYGCDYNNGSFAFCPQEFGTNFTLENPSELQSIYLGLGFHIVMNATYDNLADSTNMINGASIDIRNSLDLTLFPNENITSVPLRECVINWTADSSLIGETIGSAVTNHAADGMLPFVIVRVPLNNISLSAGDYWTLLNSKTSYTLTEPDIREFFRIDVYLFNDNHDYSYFAHRPYNISEYTADSFDTFNAPAFDVYHIIEKRTVDYTDPTDISLEIDSNPVSLGKSVAYYMEDLDGRTFSYSAAGSPNPIFFTANVNVTANRVDYNDKTVAFKAEGNKIMWTFSYTGFSAHAKCNNKNTTFIMPNWSGGITVESVADSVGNILIYTVDGGNVVVQNTQSISGIVFIFSTQNIITNITDFGGTLYLPEVLNDIKVRCDGSGVQSKLRIEIWCNDSMVVSLFANVNLNEEHVFQLSRASVSEGSGYTLRGNWDDSLDVGYIESGEFAISFSANPNIDLGSFNLPPWLIPAIVVVSSVLVVLKVLRKKKRVPFLEKSGSKLQGEGKTDEWF